MSLPLNKTQTDLAKAYTARIRRFELGSIAVFGALTLYTAAKLAPHVPVSGWLMLAAAAAAYLGADFTSGFVHWTFDTWGSVRTPIFGTAFIRPFREHHLDQEAITRHDFVETNGNNCFIGIWPQLGAALIPLEDGEPLGIFAATFLFWLVVFTMMTNQFHKWAHLRTPPRAVAVLQRLHIILPPAHHAVHHGSPFHKHYAITVGWTNWLLDAAGFYRVLERAITAVTGALPRKDDLGERAAIAVAEASAPQPLTTSKRVT